MVPSTANGFRAVVSALRSFDIVRVCFHTFTLPEDRCLRLLVKTLGRGLPESVVREDIHVQSVMQLRSVRRDQDPTKDRSLTAHFIVSVARGPEVSKVRSITELCGLRVSVESYVAPKGPLQCKRCQRFGHTQRDWIRAPVRRVWWRPQWVLNPLGIASVLWLPGQPHLELQGLY